MYAWFQKVLERLIYNHLINFLADSFSNKQFGFLASCSSLQQLLLFINNILDAKANCNNVDVLCFDYRKAFDSVLHNKLLYKLWKYGITGDPCHWSKAYLSSRTKLIGNCLDFFQLSPVSLRAVSWDQCYSSFTLTISLDHYQLLDPTFSQTTPNVCTQ